uniref:Uncharacterized protein n=1 Tax=Helianthus annuus TaxID=4232 RepID=A0A251TGU8_HELAN
MVMSVWLGFGSHVNGLGLARVRVSWSSWFGINVTRRKSVHHHSDDRPVHSVSQSLPVR